jgi:HPr kinase/phosphorylase
MVESRSVTIGTMLADRGEAGGLELELFAGARGLERRVTIPSIQKTGLALAGFDEFLHTGRVLIFGESEIRFLEGLAPEARTAACRRIVDRDIPCILITGGLGAPAELVTEADRAELPVLGTAFETPAAIAKLTAMLEDRLAVRDVIHGVLLDVLGLGVLVVGESGIGKSECALDLIVRGHRLVADDTVEVRRRAETIVLGSCPELTRHHMEIRGLGVINIRDLFGVASTRASKRVELVVQLERWDPAREYDRLGLDDERYDILGLPIPMIRMPVAPGRNVAILVEVAARNQLLRARGQHAARRLVARLERRLQHTKARPQVEPQDDDVEERR